MTGLMYHKPEDPIAFLQSCLDEAKKKGGRYAWDSFVTPAKTKSRTVFTQSKPLPPIRVGGGQSTGEKEGKKEDQKRKTGSGGVEQKGEEDEGVHSGQREDGSGRSSGELGQRARGNDPAGEAEKENKVGDHAKPQTDAELQSLASKPLIFVLGNTCNYVQCHVYPTTSPTNLHTTPLYPLCNCRWARQWEGYTVCKDSGGVSPHPPLCWGPPEGGGGQGLPTGSECTGDHEGGEAGAPSECGVGVL